MPFRQIYDCGLLAEDPTKYIAFQRAVTPGHGRKRTALEIKHLVGLFHTPGLHYKWIMRQFGFTHDDQMRRLRHVYQKQENRDKYLYLGPRNIQFFGEKELIRYYERSDPNSPKRHPQWAIPIVVNERKKGLTIREITEKYGINHKTLNRMFHTSMFDEPTINPQIVKYTNSKEKSNVKKNQI